jgi:hypothetical protein
MLTDRHVSGVVLVKTCMLEIDVHAILPETVTQDEFEISQHLISACEEYCNSQVLM